MPDVPEMASRTFRPWVPTNKLREVRYGIVSDHNTQGTTRMGFASAWQLLGTCLFNALRRYQSLRRGMLHTADTDKLMEALALHRRCLRTPVLLS